MNTNSSTNYEEILRAANRPGGTSVSQDPLLDPRVAALDLGPVRFKLGQKGSPVSWTDEQAKMVEGEYRRFLTLRVRHPDMPIVPDATVDVFWHQHILDTQKYADDCKAVFGEFMHHFPYFGLRGKEDAETLESTFKTTIEAYIAAFGEGPKGMWLVASDCGRLGCAVGNCGKIGPSPK